MSYSADDLLDLAWDRTSADYETLQAPDWPECQNCWKAEETLTFNVDYKVNVCKACNAEMIETSRLEELSELGAMAEAPLEGSGHLPRQQMSVPPAIRQHQEVA